MSKYTFSIFDGVYDEYLADVELEMSDELFVKLRDWIVENFAEEESFKIERLAEVDEAFAEDLKSAAFEYAKKDCLDVALNDISEDQDNGLNMFLGDVKNGSFIPSGWDPGKRFTAKDAFSREAYFEEWEAQQPKFGDSDYWDYINERYDLDSLISIDMITFSVVFPDELSGIKALRL